MTDLNSQPRRPGDNFPQDITFILDGAPRLVVDVGCHHGHTTMGYLDRFPDCRAYAFEAEAANYAVAERNLAAYGDRVRLFPTAVSDVHGHVTFNVNSHDGTHSTFGIGQQRFWAGQVSQVEQRQVPSVRLDGALSDLGVIDLLHMDIQGGELAALKGAAERLRQRTIKAVYCEVEIFSLYEGQPLFWDIGAFLHAYGFRFYSLYDCFYHHNNPRVMSWADALFLGPDLVDVPEHTPL